MISLINFTTHGTEFGGSLQVHTPDGLQVELPTEVFPKVLQAILGRRSRTTPESRRNVTYRSARCAWCKGTGKDPSILLLLLHLGSRARCRICRGRGRVLAAVTPRRCGWCNGSGWKIIRKCPTCVGTGWAYGRVEEG
jgi:hypothetical protein